jgi:aspartyl-tRNA(Asn)/glutamyl-tRNA(Gln) amidotransferase subunit B
VEAGRPIETWTLDWDEERQALSKMRAKETESDYRYFREPDLLPIVLGSEWQARILQALPELPLERRRRFIEKYSLPDYDAEILTEERSLSEYFEQAVGSFSGEPKTVSNWLMNDVLRLIRERGTAAGVLQLTPGHLARIIEMVSSRQITASTGKDLLEQVETSGRAPEDLVKEQGLAQLTDEASLRELARGVLQSNPQQVDLYRGGKTTLLGWFVGQLMRETGGQADPQLARQVLQDLLEK